MLIPTKKTNGPIYCLVDTYTILSVPVFALPLLIALTRLESKLKNPAIVSAASSYDSEYTEPADLVSKMELFLPTPHTFFFK